VRRLTQLAALTLLCACAGPIAVTPSAQPSAAPSASASPTQSATASPTATPSGIVYVRRPAIPLAVVVDIGAPAYTVSLVSANGTVLAATRASLPSVFASIHAPTPLVSMSDSRVYYLDGDVGIKFLASDGTTGAASGSPAGPRVAAGFAVSPDDIRIAVAQLDYSTSSAHPHERLYVENLAGGGNHIDLPVGSGPLSWPIGWYRGAIVLALGDPQGTDSLNPYHASGGYALIDSVTGRQIQSLGSDCVYGPLTAAGTACWSGSGTFGARGLDGAFRAFRNPGDVEASMALSPDGTQIAAQVGASGQPIVLFMPSDNGGILVTAIPMGWIDRTHLVFANPPAEPGVHRRIIDTVTRAITPIPDCPCGSHGIFAGVIGG
jgi:hypothetical protein